MQTRLAKQTQQLPKLSKSIPESTNASTSSRSSSYQKQDKPQLANMITYNKLNINQKQYGGISKYTSIRSNKNVDKFRKIRTHIINTYSKMQDFLSLRMQSLFLAVDIFDKFIQVIGEEQREDIQDIGLVCFMIAVKYEEIYPPTLNDIQSKMKNYISFAKYMEKQFQILQKLEYNITMQSPFQHFKTFPFKLTDQKKSFIYLYLELVALNSQIKKQHKWSQIIQAIKILFEPLNQVMEQKYSSKINNCLKRMMVQRTRLSENYLWIHRKYSNPRFHSVALKHCYLGGDI